MRADHVGAYGAGNAATPTMDALAAAGVRFANAFSVAPLTLVSHATLLTGLYPPRHGVRHNGLFQLAPEIPTVTRQLVEAGYDTGAVVGSIVLARSYGLAQGFRSYDDTMPSSSKSAESGYRERRAEAVTERAIAWLDSSTRPFFLFVHYFDPHAIYAPPEPFATRFQERPYDGEIAYVDASIGKLLDALRQRALSEKTIVILTADHGESLGEHNEKTHGYTLYDATLAVPLILAGPGVPRGAVVDRVVSLVDVAPTILSAAGLHGLPDTDGRDLAPYWTRGETADRNAYAETLSTQLDHGWSPLHAIRSTEHLYVRAPRPEVYDVRRDPAQLHNLMDGSTEQARHVSGELDGEIAGHLARERRTAAKLPDPATRERLRALGYHLADGDVAYTGMDPKDGIRWADPFFAALTAVNNGEYWAPRAFLEDMLRALPESAVGHWLLARVLVAQNELAAALSHAQEASRLLPQNASYHALLGGIFETLGRLDDASREYREADRLAPESDQTRLRHIRFRARRGEFDRANAEADRLVRSDPANSDILLQLAAIWSAVGRHDQSLQTCREAVRVDPGSELAWMKLAIYLTRSGQDEEAAEALKRAGGLPEKPGFKHELAATYAARGDSERAAALWRELLQARPDDAHAARRLRGLEHPESPSGTPDSPPIF